MFEKFKCIKYGTSTDVGYPIGEIMFVSKEVYTNDIGEKYLQGWVDCAQQDFSEKYRWLLIPEELECCDYEL